VTPDDAAIRQLPTAEYGQVGAVRAETPGRLEAHCTYLTA
jgi:hypothetical protein